MRIGLALALGCIATLSPSALGAQDGTRWYPRWEVPGLDFAPDGVWRVKARQVAELRRALLGRAGVKALPAAAPAVTGSIAFPVILFRYADVPVTPPPDTSFYRQVLFDPTPPFGRPYTLRTLYEQLSNGVFTMGGRIIGWVTLDNNESAYTGPAHGQLNDCPGNPTPWDNCNGIWSGAAFGQLQAGLREALGKVDASVDFGLYDNDGPDGTPNSGDDDGYVDMVMFAHATQDGACMSQTNNHVWAHRSTVSHVTADLSAKPGFGNVRVRDYFIQSGLGGATSCNTSEIMPVGTAAHEFGHGLALPDLYDTERSGPASEGIGQWGLMGSGNYTTPYSPSRMEAWSLHQLGWVAVVPADTAGTYRFGPAPTADTTFLVRVTGANPRGEYFLLENRQRVLADSAMIRIHGSGGLLIWHIDSLQVANNTFRRGNRVNTGAIHGVALMQADGLNHLRNTSPPKNRGDAGDPYPGATGNPQFSFNTNPAATKNSDGSFVGFAIDQIQQVVPNGEMAFRLRLGGLTVVRATDTTAVVRVDAASYNVFRDLLADGSPHTVDMVSPQLRSDGRARFTWLSWDDGGAISHSITGTAVGDTIVATVAAEYQIKATVHPTFSGGSITSSPPVDHVNGELVPAGTAIELTATTTSPDSVFGGWSGDLVSSANPLNLTMQRPYAVVASFHGPLAVVTAAPLPGGVMGASYSLPLQASGGSGSYLWTVVAGALPTGVTLSPSGLLAGRPRSTGTFAFTARVASGAQQRDSAYSIAVTEPTLVTAQVVAHLLTGASALTLDELFYLDYLGNGNGTLLDVGDFLAWVDATGAPVAPALVGRLAPSREPGR